MARDADDERAPHGGAAPAGLPAWATGESLLELLATRSPVGIVIVDSDLRCVWSNTALEQFGGGTVEERLGRRLGEIHPELDAQAVEARMQQVLETGKPLIGYIHMAGPRPSRSSNVPSRCPSSAWRTTRGARSACSTASPTSPRGSAPGCGWPCSTGPGATSGAA